MTWLPMILESRTKPFPAIVLFIVVAGTGGVVRALRKEGAARAKKRGASARAGEKFTGFESCLHDLAF